MLDKFFYGASITTIALCMFQKTIGVKGVAGASAFVLSPASVAALVGVVIAVGVVTLVKKNEYEPANEWNRNKKHEKPEQSPFYNIEEIVGDRQAVEADRYVSLKINIVKDASSDEKKQAEAETYHKQKAEPNSLGYSKQNSPNRNWENLKENCGEPGDNDPRKTKLKRKDLYELRRWVVEEVPLPPRFDYTSCVVMNCFTQGPLHIFARHSDQWLSMIPGLADLMEQLPPIIRYTIDGIQYIPERDQTLPKMKKIYKKLEDDIESEIGEIEIRAVLFKIQLKILDFLRKSVQGEYLGLSKVENGYRLEFRVTNPQGDRKVLVLAMSHQKDQSSVFFNNRPFRSIITAFFKD